MTNSLSVDGQGRHRYVVNTVRDSKGLLTVELLFAKLFGPVWCQDSVS